MDINVEEYYEQYGPMVLRRCRFLLKDEELSFDAMQEVFVRLISSKKRLKGEYPSSLLYTMATNVCLNMIRSNRRAPVSEGEDLLLNIASYDETEEKIINSELLDRIFKNEQTSTRKIAVMHFVDGMTLEQVARESGLSVSGVRKRLKKLKERAQNIKEMQ
ncbi:MAG: sigma-70 family RNA polymerase sigma factor [bacterium]|nr:sigma-70 family RNA polymerase sigma factor [bacterium]